MARVESGSASPVSHSDVSVPSQQNAAPDTSPTGSSQAQGPLARLPQRSRSESSGESGRASFQSARTQFSVGTSAASTANRSGSPPADVPHEVPVSDAQLSEVDRLDHDLDEVMDDLGEDALSEHGDDASVSGASADFATASEGRSERAPSEAPSSRPATPDVPSQASSPHLPPVPSPSSPSVRSESSSASNASSLGQHGVDQAELHRNINDIGFLQAHLPDDIGGCVTQMLSPVRSHFAPAEFAALTQRQTATLQAHGVNSKAGLMPVLKSVSRKDNLVRLAQGTIGGAHFNLPGLSTTYGVEPNEVVLGSSAKTNALQGAIGGAMAGLSDATATRAKSKTFNDAFYKRPASEQLPEPLRGVNAPSGAQSIKETNQAWVGAFGGSYVVRGAVRTATTLTHGPETAAQVESAMGTVSNVAAGIGATFIQHKVDERRGRTGLPFFMARNNLGECIDASRRPAVSYVGSAVTGAGRHAVNVVTQFPGGVKDAVTDRGLIASMVSLSGALTVPFTAAGAVQERLANHPKLGDVTGALTKYVTLEGAWAGWATAYAAGAHLQGAATRRQGAGDA